ncbi:hypothetical protein F5Y14DRAFT_423167 [Nemania sp. NC0429]|nr:hypothetical protein F5Y14DRAFT_423167 [Nemania sp. NC0429]
MAELAIGILGLVGAVDLCFKYGARLMKLCAAFRDAADEFKERILRIEASWLKTTTQLEFMRRVESLMGPYHRAIYEKLLEVLQSKLNIVISKLDRVRRESDKGNDTSSSSGSNTKVMPSGWKYALRKGSIDEAIDELEGWQRTADPSWYLILKIASPKIDQALVNDDEATITSLHAAKTIRAGLRDIKGDGSAGVFLPSNELARMTTTDIPFCEAQMATRVSVRKGHQGFLLTKVDYPPEAKVHAVRRDLRDLARKLSHDNPSTFNLLPCKGVIQHIDATTTGMPARVTFTIVFRTPPNLKYPRSLRGELVSKIEGVTLSDKFDIARQMATSISYVHTFGFVHKNICPETMVTFTEPRAFSCRTLFLIGFGSFRKDEGMTYRIGDDKWEKNLYRHPSRQGLNPSDEYVMQHDIYSLGVCLLELGLGKSFVDYDAKDGRPVLSPLLSPLIGLQGDTTLLSNPDALKKHFVRLACDELPRYMGRRYAAVVKTCLTCLDRENTDFGDEQEFLDSDGVVVGVRYIEKVLSQLHEICV